MFEKAVQLILKHEGGYVNDPKDPGGETKFGICKRSYPNIDINNLTEADAKAIYRKDYWDMCLCDALPYPIALLVFDTAVNMGTQTAIKILQKVSSVKVDGIIGPVTINKVKWMSEIELASSYSAERISRYMAIPTFDRFGTGWLKRSFETAINAFRR